MPELPEVESVARTVRPLLLGGTIRKCRVIHAIAVRPQRASALERSACGEKIRSVERRGKYLVVGLERGCLVMHFRLDGQLFWQPGRTPWSPTGGGHADVLLELDSGTLAFVDPRHFGRVLWFSHPEDCPGIRNLGLDPLSRAFTAECLAALLAATGRPLKLLLMDQTRIAGLGNIYSCESLWRARLSPRRRANSVTPQVARRLHKAIVEVLHHALECCLAPPPDFQSPDWWFRGLEKILRVYGREGKACRRCGRMVRRIEQGGRSSFYCPGCQA